MRGRDATAGGRDGLQGVMKGEGWGMRGVMREAVCYEKGML